jgi:DNA polymerase-3 subunit gamma/tau
MLKNILLKWQLVKESFFEDDALHIIAQKADGAMRDPIYFDRVVSYCGTLTRQAVTENLNVLDYDLYHRFDS